MFVPKLTAVVASWRAMKGSIQSKLPLLCSCRFTINRRLGLLCEHKKFLVIDVNLTRFTNVVTQGFIWHKHRHFQRTSYFLARYTKKYAIFNSIQTIKSHVLYIFRMHSLARSSSKEHKICQYESTLLKLSIETSLKIILFFDE